ncbi:hypothetical protein GCM10007235_00930 [Pseudoxanthomonas indica]|nr:hypothetical protein GCM10007235_00930 [Pseudoxanthomonas indica]
MPGRSSGTGAGAVIVVAGALSAERAAGGDAQAPKAMVTATDKQGSADSGKGRGERDVDMADPPSHQYCACTRLRLR